MKNVVIYKDDVRCSIRILAIILCPCICGSVHIRSHAYAVTTNGMVDRLMNGIVGGLMDGITNRNDKWDDCAWMKRLLYSATRRWNCDALSIKISTDLRIRRRQSMKYRFHPLSGCICS